MLLTVQYSDDRKIINADYKYVQGNKDLYELE